eukprot:CAMPEP_0194336122 /NCGR_PEP_ID=MMETSP0171-20130528/71928_1 /TAXON_ID=218684 /ORGANISM="Corethron pennatum, Strain L29A3" /LENGTH=684 /DNA_ID=CAMNT_0039099455 /DNA_START=159 /DNA_END=2217 /DNA_ORIENTATION=-
MPRANLPTGCAIFLPLLFVLSPAHSFVSTCAPLRISSALPARRRRRFGQSVHAPPPGAAEHPTPPSDKSSANESRMPSRPSAPTVRPRVAQSKDRSGKNPIEELERRMAGRWGTGPQKLSAGGNVGTGKAASPHRARMVADPWEDAPAKKPRRRDSEPDVVMDAPASAATADYYDEDDEGFEVSDDRTTEPIVAPAPRGGAGRAVVRGAAGGNLFSRTAAPEAAVARATVPRANKKMARSENIKRGEADSKKEATATADKTGNADTAPKKKKIPKPPEIPALLDDDGNVMCLTLDTAEQQIEEFRQSRPDMGFDTEFDADSSFADLGITHPTLLSNLEAMGCPYPLAVQRSALPPLVAGDDCLISTRTGSGKTLAFLLPLFERILYDRDDEVGNDVRVVVIAPGRELASQIAGVARTLLEGTGEGVALAIGGTSFARNVEKIRKTKPSVVVGTPGRIAELVVGAGGDRKARLRATGVRAVVLDEADALLLSEPHATPTMSAMDVLRGRRLAPPQMVLCSATASDLGEDLLPRYLEEDYAVAEEDVGRGVISTSPGTVHGVVRVPARRLQLEALRRVLNADPPPRQVLVFVNSAHRVGVVVDKLAEMGVVAAPLHGGYGSEKGERADVSRLFREGRIGCVVATEIAARGIDAPLLTHVINLDLPKTLYITRTELDGVGEVDDQGL